MSSVVANPSGVQLPYPSLFNTSLRGQPAYLAKSRPSDYFWKQGTRPIFTLQPEDNWLDSQAPAVSDSEDEITTKPPKPVVKSKKMLRLTRFRQIAFKAFTPKSDGTGQKNNIVTTTEIIQREERIVDVEKVGTNTLKKRATLLNSWKFKSTGTKTQVKKMVAVLKERISASSPAESHPKTWEEFHRYYANEEIDVYNPPLPPMEPEKESDAPSAYESRFFSAPEPPNEQSRQLTLNRLGIFGGQPYDTTEEGLVKWKGRVEAGEKMLAEGTAPLSLESAWERPASSLSNSDNLATASERRSVPPPPETLEQHPVLRKIVNECRKLFNTSLCLLSVLDDTRQIFLAESGLAEVGLADLRDITKDISFCAHTILSGRKGFAVLDAHKDWRFENGPLVQNYKVRFYAGVPLISPNLDKTRESEENACPIGTLCILDFTPREKFSTEDRKRLVYLSEYARREIERWFVRKMDYKMENLSASREDWAHQLRAITNSPTSAEGADSSHESEVLNDTPISQTFSSLPTRSFLRGNSTRSSFSTAPTSPSSYRAPSSVQSPLKASYGGLFEGIDTTLTPKMRKVFDLATTLIGQTLDLSMVLLTAVGPGAGPNGAAQTIIVSGYKIPLPTPVIDAALCFRALRAPQRGLLYQNPTAKECEEAGLQMHTSGAAKPCESALILAIGKESYLESGGFVLSGYTDNRLRVFGAEDVLFMNKFADELSRYTSKIQL
ncbi:hypothetical protein PCANC_03594 [Puccinia coronata f. sp. avenae]|uniref:GAF domain-containing protein n=1 Tax=Puccinia coronata f. sp. avenae TaxID=200324 RepID=A0A2N5U293_9BASI|nr:hypothetical protein PCASD_13211 [Puccinia coronata f. sp. avenae]PLW53786.1 hypothetical protein PCANC_03594 [Puccinia coronata f. sp. avenae]